MLEPIGIHLVRHDQNLSPIRSILWEYLQWANSRIVAEYGVSFDIAAILEQDLLGFDKFLPPSGCFILAAVADQPAGIVGLQRLDAGRAVIKRMFVRPAHRKIGLGRLMLEKLLDEAARMSYQQIVLDSAGFMTEAHRLYKSFGFRETGPFAGSDIPPEYRQHWVFMRKDLAPGE